MQKLLTSPRIRSDGVSLVPYPSGEIDSAMPYHGESMTDAAKIVEDFRRYSQLIRGELGRTTAFVAEAEDPSSIQVERGLVFPSALLDPRGADVAAVEPLIEISTSDRLGSLAIVDRSGHHRPVYRGLLVYSWLQAFALTYETLPQSQFGRWEEALRAWCDLLEGELGQIEWLAGPMPAGRGSSATESAWMGLALHVAGKVFVRDAWTDLASDTFGKLVRSHLSIKTRVASSGMPGEGVSGPFLLATASDNPETHWYHELVLLHAAASYAVQAEDRTVAAAVARNAEFHLIETQPDHGSTQPWAVFAFLWHPKTRSLADQLLHNASTQPSGISLMLLADALYSLERFTK
jgi:hypothetical protein